MGHLLDFSHPYFKTYMESLLGRRRFFQFPEASKSAGKVMAHSGLLCSLSVCPCRPLASEVLVPNPLQGILTPTSPPPFAG